MTSTAAAGLKQSGWGQGACSGDYDNDGTTTVRHVLGTEPALSQPGNGTFEEVTARLVLRNARPRWGRGCAFLDYDRDGRLDLFAATTSTSTSRRRRCPKTGIVATRGSRSHAGLPGSTAERTSCSEMRQRQFTEDEFRSAPGSDNARTELTRWECWQPDFDNDGWAKIYVANDSNPIRPVPNNQDGNVRI